MRPSDDQDLCDYFTGVWAAQMGLKSACGGQIEQLKQGILLCGRGVEPDERALEAACNIGRVEEILVRLSRRHQLVLRAYYAHAPRGAWLPHWGPVSQLARELGLLKLGYAAGVPVAFQALWRAQEAYGEGARSRAARAAKNRRTCGARERPWHVKENPA